jgi:uncharacterized cupin superfamily protein
MKVVNLFGDEWDFDGEENPEGYRRRARQVGAALGGELLGATLYELPSGERTWPYHFEHGNEEWLLCVSGRPTLRTPEGERELEPGDVAWFGRGPEGAHQVRNDSGEPARVLIASTKVFPDVSEYPDSGKIRVRTEGSRYNLARKPELDYWDSEA